MNEFIKLAAAAIVLKLAQGPTLPKIIKPESTPPPKSQLNPAEMGRMPSIPRNTLNTTQTTGPSALRALYHFNNPTPGSTN